MPQPDSALPAEAEDEGQALVDAIAAFLELAKENPNRAREALRHLREAFGMPPLEPADLQPPAGSQ